MQLTGMQMISQYMQLTHECILHNMFLLYSWSILLNRLINAWSIISAANLTIKLWSKNSHLIHQVIQVPFSYRHALCAAFHHHHATRPALYYLNWITKQACNLATALPAWESSYYSTCRQLLQHAAADHYCSIAECTYAKVSLLLCWMVPRYSLLTVQELVPGVWLATIVSTQSFGCPPLQSCQYTHNSSSTRQVCSIAFAHVPLWLSQLHSFLYIHVACSEYAVYSTRIRERPLRCEIRCRGTSPQSLPTVDGDPRIYYLFSPGFGRQE